MLVAQSSVSATAMKVCAALCGGGGDEMRCGAGFIRGSKCTGGGEWAGCFWPTKGCVTFCGGGGDEMRCGAGFNRGSKCTGGGEWAGCFWPTKGCVTFAGGRCCVCTFFGVSTIVAVT